jgi:hypothetical protein
VAPDHSPLHDRRPTEDDPMATRPSTNEPFTCVTCEIEIAGRPTFHVGLAFCCAGCVADGPCICSYDQETDGDQVRECLDVESVAEHVPSSRDRELVTTR